MGRKFFTINEANGLLPLIDERLHALQHVKSEASKRLKKLRQLKMDSFRMEGKDRAPSDDVFTIECELEFAQIEARALLKAIQVTGAELKDVDMGLVDFPSMLHGEEVLLCWKQGEERIMHYHSSDDGYAGRKRIE